VEGIYFIIDFDSTFIQTESLEKLSVIASKEQPDRSYRIEQIAKLTSMAMNGEMSFEDSLRQRISLLRANRNDLESLVKTLKRKITPSFQRNKRFFQENQDHIIILSSGFHEFIDPIVSGFGLNPENIYANRFSFNETGEIQGVDELNPLAHNGGKVAVVRKLKLKGEVYVIGDGYTDYELKKAGLADHFYAFTENVSRDYVVKHADHVLPNLDELLFKFRLPASVSYPKNRIKVLLLENIHPEAVKILKQEGYEVETYTGAWDEATLIERIPEVSILGIRSKTIVTAKVISNAPKLLAIGAFCIGTNQIDLETADQQGIAVFNAPYSNTRSVVELAIAEMIMLIRRIPDKSIAMHQGKWDKSAANSREIRGKKLGIVGYGNIGSQLSVLAESLGMEVYFYDIVDRLALGNARKCNSLKELLKAVDIVSLHVDGRDSNTDLFGKAELSAIRKGTILINLSRGHVCDISMLAQAVRNGKIAGLGVDVFPDEPATNKDKFISELQGLPNVILTPHIGGSTEEAQENIARFVPAKIIDYVNSGTTYGSVNMPNLTLPEQKNVHRLIHIHRNIPGVMAQINGILAKNQVNIEGQYLKTNEQIGYVITDINKAYDKGITKELKAIEGTIRFRVLY
jgi:D-3-phosphoglycerate dehydrogenase / 2-oxoglutarate reductase